MDVYEKFAREVSYTQESYNYSFDVMLDKILGGLMTIGEDENKVDVCQRLKEEGKASYEQSLALYLKLLRETYTPEQIEIVYSLNQAHPWLQECQKNFAEQHYERYNKEIAQPLTLKIIREAFGDEFADMVITAQNPS